MYMKDWVKRLDAFLKFNERDVLTNAGKVSHEVARKLAETEFEKYHIIQDRQIESDFDVELKKLTEK